MHEVINATRAPDKAFAYVLPLLWTQIVIGWSLISASIPSFRAFMQPFAMVQDHEHSISPLRSQNNGAYMMMGPGKSAARSKGGSNMMLRSDESKNIGRLRLDDSQSDAVIESVPAGKRSEEAGSVDSWHSRADIIRRDVRWEISRDQAQTPEAV
jgi:hypothetical protein